MKTMKIYQADAFASRLFTGNPAAVCILEEIISDELMQSIAAENMLSETAFIQQKNEIYEIRWFTPTVEVDLCGHATLAAAFVLFKCLDYREAVITFHSIRSGILKVSREKEKLMLDFPSDVIQSVDAGDQIQQAIDILPSAVYKGKTDFIAFVENEALVRNLKPDFNAIAQLKARGLIVTAKGDEVDFVSRFFAPQSGINEDPVTGSAHTSLIPLWAEKLGKKEMTARQLSERGGELSCIYQGTRCLIGGEVKLYLSGEINIG